MRIFFVLSIALIAHAASADPWKTTAEVQLLKKPRGKAITKLPAGTQVVIEREEGDWVRVRVGKRVGYVARKAVVDAAPADDSPAEPVVEPVRIDPAIASRKTTIEVVLRKKPGERQAVVAKLAPSTAVVIETEEGRWYRVRAGKLVGYLPRTTLEEPPAPPPPAIEPATGAPPQRWSSERATVRAGTTGLVVGVTAASATLHAEARAGAQPLGQARRGDRFGVVTADAAWVHVRTPDGRDAWLARADVDDATAGVAIAGTPDRDTRHEPGATVVRAASVRAGVALGYRSLGMDFTSNGSTGLSNYLVSADAAAAALDVEATARLARLRIGVDGRVELGTSSPGEGIEYVGPSLAGGRIAFGTFAADGGVRVGMRAKRVFDVAARAGFHYDAFVAKEVLNAGRLPREHLYGPTVGARIGIVPPASRVDVELRADLLALGRRGQTAGLEDGADSTAHAVWAGATIRIALGRHLALVSAYDFGRATTEWTGMSVRDPSATTGRRVDSTQTVQIGLAAQR